MKRIQPPFINFNNLINCCSCISQLQQVHALIFTNGSHKSLPVSTKLINKSVSLSMDYARKVFDIMSHRDLFLYNTLIRSYSDVGPFQEALFTYRNMFRTGLLPDCYTFIYVIKSCSLLSALWEGKQVHCNVIKIGFHVDVYIQSSLVTMYAQNGDALYSEQAFGDIAVRNVVTWTSMIAAYVQNGFLVKGLMAFVEMLSSGTKPNVVTLVSVLPACVGVEFSNVGMLIHGLGVKLGVDSYVSLTNSLIGLYGKCGRVEIARALFDQMEVRTLVSWNAMIASYEQNNACEDAIQLFQKMQGENIDVDKITMVSVISACAGLGALDAGKWVHDLVKRTGLESDVAVTNALIDMYAKCGSIDSATNIFNSLLNRSVVSWTSIIGAYASHGRGKEAIMLFAKMREEGIRPNSLTFIAVLTACRHSGLLEEGRRHFHSMSEEYLITPGLEHCNSMVDLLGRHGTLMEAYEFIENMPIEPDVDVWGALLNACRIHGNLELAECVAHKIFQFTPRNDGFYVTLKTLYAEAGRWEEVTRFKKILDEMEVNRIPGQSSAR
uniref:pentatricopeptide repeat-containing protein At1g11290, chloroplastic-like n=1 Tax=Erigeron canadensis TaxID=72917 RepID=UPI001CB8C02A|nr:pentatricopeptide repeat-containing protein At1g11290, chloroplastic-like [Erigeron canadensis]